MEKFVFLPPFAQWLFVLPSLPIGFCLGVILREVPPKNQTIWFLGIFIAVLLTFAVFFYLKKDSPIIPYCLGLLLVILSVEFRFPFESVAVQMGKLTYGIYLIHLLALSFLFRRYLVAKIELNFILYRGDPNYDCI